jgi:hypothetical protein
MNTGDTCVCFFFVHREFCFKSKCTSVFSPPFFCIKITLLFLEHRTKCDSHSFIFPRSLGTSAAALYSGAPGSLNPHLALHVGLQNYLPLQFSIQHNAFIMVSLVLVLRPVLSIFLSPRNVPTLHRDSIQSGVITTVLLETRSLLKGEGARDLSFKFRRTLHLQ